MALVCCKPEMKKGSGHKGRWPGTNRLVSTQVHSAVHSSRVLGCFGMGLGSFLDNVNAVMQKVGQSQNFPIAQEFSLSF